MKKVEIIGAAKIEAYRSGSSYASVQINGMELDVLLADKLLDSEKDEDGTRTKTALCRVSITIEPYTETLSVNGQEMALEL